MRHYTGRCPYSQVVFLNIYLIVMNLMKTVAKNIRKYKSLQDVSYLKIAKKAGIPFTTLETILYKKRRDLKVSTLQKIAKALKVSVDDLLQ